MSRAEMQRQFRERLHELEREHLKEEEREEKWLERIGEIHRVHPGPHGPHHLDAQHDLKPHRVRSSISISKYESPFDRPTGPRSRAQVGYDMSTALLAKPPSSGQQQQQQQQQHVVLNVDPGGGSAAAAASSGSDGGGDEDHPTSNAVDAEGAVRVSEV